MLLNHLGSSSWRRSPNSSKGTRNFSTANQRAAIQPTSSYQRGGFSSRSTFRSRTTSTLAARQESKSNGPLYTLGFGFGSNGILTQRRFNSTFDQSKINSPNKSYVPTKESNGPRILITGSLGQIGTELTSLLRKRYGKDNVIATDVKMPSHQFLSQGPYYYLDVMDENEFNRIVVENGIRWVIHLSSLLSAAGERNPQLAIQLNVNGLHNVMEICRKYNLRCFAPSSIAAFGPTTPKDQTPDLTIMRPSTIYGVTKVYLELLGEYYHDKFGVDFRSLRYPGIISSEALPGGGTTDYAVEIFYEALLHGKYSCFLGRNSELPMMYMPDALKATLTLLEAPKEKLSQRVYNVTGMSFTPALIAEEIQKFMPHFTIKYNPDFRQDIADSWPKSLDDTLARRDWNWKHEYDLNGMTQDMLVRLKEKLEAADPTVKIPQLQIHK